MSFTKVKAIIDQRCVTCHSAAPTHPTAPVTPLGVAFDSAEEIKQWAERIYERSVVAKTMPLVNLTQMTDEERQVLSLWYNSGVNID